MLILVFHKLFALPGLSRPPLDFLVPFPIASGLPRMLETSLSAGLNGWWWWTFVRVIGRLRSVFSRTFKYLIRIWWKMIFVEILKLLQLNTLTTGPWGVQNLGLAPAVDPDPLLVACDVSPECEWPWGTLRGVNPCITCVEPSGKMNFSRSSMFVRPFARQGSCLTRNSSRASQPPPTRTITVERKMRTSRSFWLSPN